MNLLGRVEEKHNQDLQSTFQAYLDYQSPNYGALKQQIYTLDFDYQSNLKANARNDVSWGSGVRYISTGLTGSESINIRDYEESESIFSAFVQDQIALLPKEVYLTLGSKFEHNSFTGFEVAPSARIAWYPDNKQTVWASVSRAVRTPGIGERSDISNNILSLAPGAVAQQKLGPNAESEDLIAYELGYRVKPNQKVSIDSTVFLNDYDKLNTFEPVAPEFTPDGAYFPFLISNLGQGHAYGFETSVNWSVTSRWNLLANYSYINLLLDGGDSLDPTFNSKEDQVPHHKFSVRSQLFLPYDTQLINTAYYVDDLPADAIQDYIRFDSQVIWRPKTGLEVSLVGQNLLDNKHSEFTAPPAGIQNEIPRAYYLRATLRY